jgi:hypothetical protein
MTICFRFRFPKICDLLGVAMTRQKRAESTVVLSAVALLHDRPEDNLARDQVGTVVEDLNETSVLVEFSDDQGRAYGIVPCARSEPIVLHYDQETA